MDMDIITLCLLLGVVSGVLHPAQGCKILVFVNEYFQLIFSVIIRTFHLNFKRHFMGSCVNYNAIGWAFSVR